MTSIRSHACTVFSSTRWFLLSVILTVLCSTNSAKAEYRLHAGDVIEIAVAGMPELRQRVTVQMDGSISLPLLGTLIVAGSSASEARTKIRSALVTKVLRQRMTDGREKPLLIEPDEVAATVVEYRPIYVSGAVTRPGEQTYRPHMTVRQAVAASGGYGYNVPQLGTSSAAREAIQLRADHTSTWLSFAKEQAHIWQIKSELGAESAFDQDVFKRAPLLQTTLSEILKREAEHMKAQKANHEREKVFLLHSIKQANEHIAILSGKKQKEEEGRKADELELQRVTALFERGNLIKPRVTEARRDLLWTSTRELETTARLTQVIRQRNELSRRLERLDDERKINLLQELKDVSVRLKAQQAKLQSIEEKFQHTGWPQAAQHNSSAPKITVFRKGENGEIRLVADNVTVLQPGDVVEVVLPAEHIVARTNKNF